MNKNEKHKKNDLLKKHKRLIGILISFALVLLIVVITPISLDKFIFGNTIKSNLTNGEWASFFGSFLGGIIGAIIAGGITIYGIYLTIEHNKNMIEIERKTKEEEAKKELIRRHKPLFHIVWVGSGGGIQNNFFIGEKNNNIIINRYKLTNVGADTAANISAEVDFCNFEMTIVKKNLFQNKTLILKEGVEEIALGMPNEKSELNIYYEDIMGNKYKQTVFFENLSEYKCSMNMPELISNTSDNT